MDQLAADEKKKIFDLMKDRELGGNMDWMYRGAKPDTEEYLLGKQVDENISGETTSNVEGSVGSLFSERIKANVALDMQAKMREDPLFAIRKKEEEARRRLLENPVKMKQLEKLIVQQQKFKAKKAKKTKKKKKKKHKGSDSESDSSDSEDDLVNKYLSILTQKQKAGDAGAKDDKYKRSQGKIGARDKRDKSVSALGDTRNARGRDSGHWYGHGRKQIDYSEPSQKAHRFEHSKKDFSRQKSASPVEQSRCSMNDNSDSGDNQHSRLHEAYDSDKEGMKKQVYGLIKSVRLGAHVSELSTTMHQDNSRSKSIKHSRSRSSSDLGSSLSSRSLKHNKSSDKNEYRNTSASCKTSHRHRSRSPVVVKRTTSNSRKVRSKSRSPPKKKLSAEDREKKLQEMMENARWREEQRNKNVERFRKEEAEEEEKVKAHKGDAKFLSSMMSSHASASSVEDRLKRNKYNIQRTRAALDKNFTKQ